MNASTNGPGWRIAQPWRLSRNDWLAYERNMNDQEDDERWIMEMEGEASAAVTHSADLNTSNAPC